MVTSSFERHLHSKVWFTYGACVRVVYSLNSLSCMVKYGLKSLQYFKGEIQLQGRKIRSFCIYTVESFIKEKSNLKLIKLWYIQIHSGGTQLPLTMTHLVICLAAPLHLPHKCQHSF